MNSDEEERDIDMWNVEWQLSNRCESLYKTLGGSDFANVIVGHLIDSKDAKSFEETIRKMDDGDTIWDDCFVSVISDTVYDNSIFSSDIMYLDKKKTQEQAKLEVADIAKNIFKKLAKIEDKSKSEEIQSTSSNSSYKSESYNPYQDPSKKSEKNESHVYDIKKDVNQGYGK
jgi:hypothetical protein